jgi:hypothetical protein
MHYPQFVQTDVRLIHDLIGVNAFNRRCNATDPRAFPLLVGTPCEARTCL